MRADFVWGARTYVMGILNVTPDSFSGDGLGDDPEAAVQQALRMEAEGADIIDIGGMSTRPSHVEVPIAEELRRVMAVLPELVARLRVPVSIDTFRYDVAAAALRAGAAAINDVWGLQREPRLAELAAGSNAMLFLMHNQDGTEYDDLLPDIAATLARGVATAEAAGVRRRRLVVDPGIGFGKTADQNLEVLARLLELKSLGLPILLGTSRKSTIGKVLGTDVADRVEGTAATVALGIAAGADIIRVHEVAQMAKVARMADAVVRRPEVVPA
ncbi:MAG TPA: dihydropteroate synthase [Candidatus Dormibacteraeota bacterium]|nr:dihydropteroate synthase [Candidatus Dormibacteraeota bacterium]